jgi:hypothetical protein
MVLRDSQDVPDRVIDAALKVLSARQAVMQARSASRFPAFADRDDAGPDKQRAAVMNQPPALRTPVVPVTLFIIFLLLCLNFRSITRDADRLVSLFSTLFGGVGVNAMRADVTADLSG